MIAGVSFDLTFTAGNLLECAILAGGGVLALSKFSTKFALFHADLSGVKTDVGDMKTDIKKVNELLASAREADRRIGRLEDDLDALRRGEGWITARRRDVDGEYQGPG